MESRPAATTVMPRRQQTIAGGSSNGDLTASDGAPPRQTGKSRTDGLARRQRRASGSVSSAPHGPDVFDNQAPPRWRADLFGVIRATPELNWLLLTKRPQNIRKMLPADWGEGYPNVWLGITAEDAARYRSRWPILARVPAVCRFISYEPALGSLGTIDIIDTVPDWIICGGESGPGHRLIDPQWARDVRDQCAEAGVSYFFKQWGGATPKSGGKVLDGREWCDVPFY